MKWKHAAHFCTHIQARVLLCADAIVCKQYKSVALTVEHVTCEVEREEALLGAAAKACIYTSRVILYALVHL